MSTQTPPARLTSLHLRQAKGRRKLAMITAYDYPSAVLADAAGVDALLVGDSLGMTVLGDQDTLSVNMDHMIHHCRAVTAARTHALVVCDMPFLSCQSGARDALRNAGRLVTEGGARAVKIEGRLPVQARMMVRAGIPVMGHAGLSPQQVAIMGGYKIQGRTAAAARTVLEDCLVLQDAGCFAVVLECVPGEVAARITEALEIPTIGIGAGADCDGQVLVWHDMLGLNTGHTPRFVKRYADLGRQVTEAVARYAREVREGSFPDAEHGFALADEDERAAVEAALSLPRTPQS